MTRILTWLAIFCAGGIALGVVGSYLGAIHPVGDSLAVFRFWLAGASIAIGVMLLAMLQRTLGLVSIVLGVAAISGPALDRMPIAQPAMAFEAGAETYTLYQRNLLYLAREAPAIFDEIAQRGPDFITLQEVSEANRTAILNPLSAVYTPVICPFAAVGAVAIASRYPIIQGTETCLEGLGLVLAQVQTPDGPVWLGSVHLHWPWPYRQAEQVEHLLPILASLDGPVILGGDFNMVRRSHTLRRIARTTGTTPAAQGQPTFRFDRGEDGGIGLEIDFIFLPDTAPATVDRLDFLGSDHKGLWARFSLVP